MLIYLCGCAFVCIHMCAETREQLEGIRRLCPSAMWVLGMELKSAGLVACAPYLLGLPVVSQDVL